MPEFSSLALCGPSDAGEAKLDEALVDKNFPVFLTRYGPAIGPVTDPSVGPPAIVLSVPKSGTYFTEALYKRMGYSGVYVHAMAEGCNDVRFQGAAPRNLQIAGDKAIPITILSRLVLPGQIIVSHCGHSAAIEAALSGFKEDLLFVS